MTAPGKEGMTREEFQPEMEVPRCDTCGLPYPESSRPAEAYSCDDCGGFVDESAYERNRITREAWHDAARRGGER
jgi:hypothetical protein